jgi:hypothetical protein
MSVRAISSTRLSSNTPITTCCAPAALVIGPNRLKAVRTPRALRTGATVFIAGWFIGAYINPTPHSATLWATMAGVISILTPGVRRGVCGVV